MSSPTVTPIAATEEQLAEVEYDANGLVPAIVQEEGTGRILMMAWMNDATLRQSLEEGRTVFWSRSRQEVWRKGDTSGDRQYIRSA
jgi:phosphoribosyl-AMP cyclohydrolase